MRRVALAGAVVVAVLIFGAAAHSMLRFSGYPNVSKVPAYQATTAANKAGAIALTHGTFSWITDANAVWSNATIPRYNKAAVRWPAGYSSHIVSVNVQCTGLANSDGKLAVVVDGALAATINATGSDTLVRRYNVVIPTLPTSYLEVWEPFSARYTLNNNGVDEPYEACYVVGAFLPPGQTLTAPTYSKTLITMGDSIVSACVGTCTNSIEAYDGLLGKLRTAANAKSWATVSLDYGSGTLLGDGLTAANWITLIQAAQASTGVTNANTIVYIQIGRNDWNYYNQNGLGSTPTQIGTALQAIVSGLPAAYTIVITSPWPQTSESANPGGFTLPNYRTAEEAVTGSNLTIVHGGTACSLNPATMTGDGVHFNTLGVTTALPCVETPLGLP